MKRNNFIASLLLGSSILLQTACVNQIDTEETIQEGNIPINFSLGIKKPSTKVTNNAFETGDQIGVYAMVTGNQINQERYIDNLLLKYSTGNNLIPQKPVFYPEGDATLDFIAYYPYQSDGVTPNSSILPVAIHTDQSIAANHSASDFMTATTTKVSNTSASVSLEFHHRLTKLTITLQPGKDEDVDEMLASNPRIIASNFYTQASYDLLTEEFDKLDQTADIISAGEWKESDGKLTGKEFIFIPQKIDGTQVLQMEWNGRIYTCPIPTLQQLEGNKQYELVINAEETESLELEGILATIHDWPLGEALENVENEYANEVLHLSVLSFEPSNLYRIHMNGKEVAEICKEYLTGNLNSTAITAYPLHNGTPDLTQGTVLQLLDTDEDLNGGTICWNIEKNTFTYNNGSQPCIRQIYFDEAGNLQIEKPEQTATINIVAHTLKDMRNAADIVSYPIVKIGTQYWMRENLRADHYRDGTSLELQQELNGTPGYFKAEDDLYFYNGEALEVKEISPDGWELPAMDDWEKLGKYVNNDIAMLKAGEWGIMNTGEFSEIKPVNNKTMFNLFSNGQWNKRTHINQGLAAGLWVWNYDTESINGQAIFFSGESNEMQKASSISTGQDFYKGLSVRCIKQE